jgi:Bacterial Ig-like domain (group 1)
VRNAAILRSDVKHNGKSRLNTIMLIAGAALLIAAFGSFLATNAGATVTSGSTISGAIVTTGTVAAGTPYSSGQSVNISVPANSVFNSTIGVHILECAAPNGVDPTDPASCDGNTIQGPTVLPAADGSVSFSTAGGAYTLYALPDSLSLGERDGPACNLTNECVLYIGTDQSDFTQPHVWSAPFYIAPNSNDEGENPGDGSAPPVATLPSSAKSMVSAASSTDTADSVNTDVITVTLLDATSVPVVGKTVTLSQGTGHSTITPAATPDITNASGQATFSVTDATAESVTYTATDTTDSFQPTQTPIIAFAAPVVTNSHSSITATPSTVDLSAPSMVTVTLRDQGVNPAPVAGKTITLSQGSGSAVITPSATPNVTDASGEATFTVTDATAEQVNFGATDTTDNIVLAATAPVTFGTLTVLPSVSTVTAPATAPVGTHASDVTVTLLTSTASPVPGVPVTLAGSPSTSVTISSGSTPELTNSQGQAIFTVTDTVAQAVTFSAAEGSGSTPLTAKATIQFQTPAPSGAVSTITGGGTGVPADGLTQVEILVTVTDQFDDPEANKVVTLKATPSENVQFRPVQIGGGGTAGTTNASGVAEFEADDTSAETVTFTATDVTDSNLAIHGSVTASFVAGVAAADQSTVSATPDAVPADGTTASTVTVTLLDHNQNPVSGKTVTLAATGGKSHITTTRGVSAANGTATFSVTDSTAEVVTYSATDATDSLPIIAQAVVTFGSPPAPPPVVADCAMSSNDKSVVADGTTPATITILLYDAAGAAVPGKKVTLTPSGGSSVIKAETGATTLVSAVRSETTTASAVAGTTGSNGVVAFQVTDTTPESVTYTATDTTDNVVLAGLTATVSFTASSTTGTTTTTTPTSTTTTTTTTPTTTTTLPPTSTGTGDQSNGSSSAGGTSSTTSGSGSSLAFTGSPTRLPFLLALGGVLLVVGSLGRRLTLRRQ